MKSSPPGKTPYHHGDLKAALETAALDLVTEKGPRAFTLAEASRRAGVSVGAPYKHFADRDALLAALAARGYRLGEKRMTAAVRLEVGSTARFERFAAEYVRFAAEERALFEIIHLAGLDKRRYPDVVAAQQSGYRAMLELTREARDDELAAMSVLNSVVIGSHGVAMFLLDSITQPTTENIGLAMREASRIARLIAENQDWVAASPFS
ncbi:TetR/AcrR family transcriptional regulator [Herbiconiux sp. CPCC 205763]|uniref:TetR/AcrR family transcriptional regulator n=1 Tax=Herbiconiux aconitum TaxID=2970913 RepID=A0ABT2GT27_9MICO|nr:TetR/AcrR family transcriptional regulator [Herbiconiux aconitum]MCS5719379.1 TetR/AcrR family transcriptional regulator [Herbiconiux aconitum]